MLCWFKGIYAGFPQNQAFDKKMAHVACHGRKSISAARCAKRWATHDRRRRKLQTAVAGRHLSKVGRRQSIAVIHDVKQRDLLSPLCPLGTISKGSFLGQLGRLTGREPEDLCSN